MIIFPVLASIVSIMFGLVLIYIIKQYPTGEGIQIEIWNAIREGSRAYLRRQNYTVGGVAVVMLRFDNFIQADNEEFIKSFDKFIKQGSKKIVLDFITTQYMSSLTLASLVYIQKKIQKEGGSLVFCNVKNRVQEVVAMTNLDKVFDIVDTKAEAIAKLNKK